MYLKIREKEEVLKYFKMIGNFRNYENKDCVVRKFFLT